MDRTRRLMYAALGVVGAFLLVFGGHAEIARADVVGPSIPSKIGSLPMGVVVLICIVAIVAVVIGGVFIRRIRAKRASGPGTGS